MRETAGPEEGGMRKEDPGREEGGGSTKKRRTKTQPSDKPETHFTNLGNGTQLSRLGERGSAVGDRASAVGGRGGPPEDGYGSEDLQDDGVSRWRRMLCETPRPKANYVHTVWLSTCIALHPHSPLWRLLEIGTFRGQRSTRPLVLSDPFFLFNPAMSVVDLKAHYVDARYELQTSIRTRGRTGRLLEDIPCRPAARNAVQSWSRPSVPDPACDKMIGMILSLIHI